MSQFLLFGDMQSQHPQHHSLLSTTKSLMTKFLRHQQCTQGYQRPRPSPAHLLRLPV